MQKIIQAAASKFPWNTLPTLLFMIIGSKIGYKKYQASANDNAYQEESHP
ncbi:unnamed protein product, partial [marine sediment metagenome]